MMRALVPGERACMLGPDCHAQKLPRGSPAPRFRHWDLCVICMRAETLARWLVDLGTVTKTRVVQPFYVTIGPGEYSLDSCLPPWPGAFDGVSDPFPRFDPLRLSWDGPVLRQLDMGFRAFPRQVLLPNDLPDVFGEFMLCGLLAPRDRGEDAGILGSMKQALWASKQRMEMNLQSTWIRALHTHLGKASLDDPDARVAQDEAARCVCAFLVWYARQNPVIEARLRELHPKWSRFCIWATHVGRGAGRHLTKISPPPAGPPVVIPLPCHRIAEAQDRVSYYCPTCFNYKGFVFDPLKRKPPPSKKKKKQKKPVHDMDGNLIRRGNDRVAFCWETRREMCLHVKTTGRKSRRSTCIEPLRKLNIYGCGVQIKNTVFVPCFKCGMLHRRITNIGDCGLCERRTLACCLVCHSKKRLWPVTVFESLGMGKDLSLFLCFKHLPRQFSEYARWNRHHLLRTITEEKRRIGNKKHGAVVRRS